jgi:hypothetical protein
MKTQHLESLIVGVDVCHKPLLKMSFFSSSSVNTTERMEVERMIVLSGEVGRAARPYVLEVR